MHEIISTLQDIWHTVHQGGFQSLGPLSYVLIAVLVATEGPITTLIGAAGAAAGLLDIRFVFLATAIGNIVGDALWYAVGYASKGERLYRFGGRFGLHRRHIEHLEDEMRTHASKAILVAKISFGLIIPTLVAAGLARVPLRKWAPAVLIAETLWTVLLVSLGFRAAGAIAEIGHGFRIVGLVAAVVAITFVILFFRHKLGQFATSPEVAGERTRSVVQPLSQSVAAHRQMQGKNKREHKRSRSTAMPSRVVSTSQVLEKA